MYLNHWALINLPDAQNFALLIVSFSTRTQRQSQTPLIGTQWQETTGTDWKTRNSISKKEKKTLRWWPSARKGGAGMSWNLHSLRYSKQNWTQPCSACSEQGSWTRWSSEVSPNHSNFMILWSYNYLQQAFDIRAIACSHWSICTFLKIRSQYWYILSHLGQNRPKRILSNFK